MVVLPPIAKLKGLALDFLFPPRCVSCGRGGDFICASCRRSLIRITPPLCPRCGLPQPGGVLCPGCLRWQAEIDGIRSPFRFEGVIRQAVHQLKYQNLRALAAPLAGWLGEYFQSNAMPAEVLAPVPLHPKRLRERGYNQAKLLAEELGRLINLPVAADCLIREKPTPPQARSSTVEERRRNVAGAFACRDRRLEGQQVLLIDDVCTSGATLDAAAAAVKAAGAATVWGLALAREI